MFRPAVHHSQDKMCCITFFNGGEYKRLNVKLADRKAALTYMRCYYPRAKKVSIVFYIPKVLSETTDKSE